MLKYIKAHMATIDGIEIYPVISILIFFTFFVGLGIYVWKTSKNHTDRMSQLPLD